MTGATLYAKLNHTMWMVKVRHSGGDLKQFINKPIDWNKNPDQILTDYLIYHKPSNYDLKATRKLIVSDIPHIWDNSREVKENIDLFNECHYIRVTSGLEDDYNCSYEDYTYLLDFDNKNIVKIRELC
jgi:hypothetical protein